MHFVCTGIRILYAMIYACCLLWLYMHMICHGICMLFAMIICTWFALVYACYMLQYINIVCHSKYVICWPPESYDSTSKIKKNIHNTKMLKYTILILKQIFEQNINKKYLINLQPYVGLHYSFPWFIPYKASSLKV